MKVESGYRGLLEGRISQVDRRRLGGIIGRGGTVLGTQRSKVFQTFKGQQAAASRLEEAGWRGWW
jgi:6-phosphofructokinase 1